ncbi:hypothetical protein [Microbispora sp. CA-102843]|uniref:hypothetical protein n=1 Tax=Microbispora sp. CA-102843 TaxID=3239952 RepID=UPI003D9015F3
MSPLFNLAQTAFWLTVLAAEYLALRPAARRKAAKHVARAWRPIAYRGRCVASSARAVARAVTFHPYKPSHAPERHA